MGTRTRTQARRHALRDVRAGRGGALARPPDGRGPKAIGCRCTGMHPREFTRGFAKAPLPLFPNRNHFVAPVCTCVCVRVSSRVDALPTSMIVANERRLSQGEGGEGLVPPKGCGRG